MTGENPASPPSTPAAFVTTQWTRVLLARGDSPEAKAALSDLCAASYEPVFAFIRRNTPDPEAAKDLTQDFFACLLARQGLHTVDPGRGRFRSFLLGAVKHFLADARDRANCLKRGAGQQLESTTREANLGRIAGGGPECAESRTRVRPQMGATLLDRLRSSVPRTSGAGKADSVRSAKTLAHRRHREHFASRGCRNSE